jgi:hypothetical protein
MAVLRNSFQGSVDIYTFDATGTAADMFFEFIVIGTK